MTQGWQTYSVKLILTLFPCKAYTLIVSIFVQVHSAA